MGQDKFGWLKTYYDKVIVIVMMVALIASALYLVLRIGQVRGQLTASDDDLGQFEKHAVVKVDQAEWEQKIDEMQKPFQSGIFSNQLMVSELRVYCTNELCAKPIPYHAAVCPFCKVAQPTLDPSKRDDDMDGLPNSFEQEHGLNPNDPDDAQADLDGDGFTNLEEYNWGAKIDDDHDYPTVVAKLRVFKIVSRPFMMRFKAVSSSADGSHIFQLNMRTLDKTFFAKLGDVVEGFTVKSYKEDIVDSPMGKKNNSVLILTKDGRDVELIYNRAQKRQERVAGLVFLLNGKKYRVQIDDEIKIRGKAYKIIDIGRNRVLIRDIETDEDIPVVMLSDEERIELQGGSRDSSAQGSDDEVESETEQQMPVAGEGDEPGQPLEPAVQND